MRLDKTYFRKQSFEEASEHQVSYSQMSDDERSAVFLQLMQAAFGFVGENWPPMDKNFFTKRKQS